MNPVEALNRRRGELLENSNLLVESRLTVLAGELHRGNLVSPPMSAYHLVIETRTELQTLRQRLRRRTLLAWGLLGFAVTMVFL